MRLTANVSLLLALAAAVGVSVACSDATVTASEREDGNEMAKTPDGGDVDAGEDASAAFEPPVACGATLPGPPLATTVESEPGFADELDATDVSSVPDPLDYGSTSKLTRGIVNYMLGRSSGTSLTRADATAAGTFGRIILAAAAKDDAGGIDLGFLRRGLHHAYLCSRPVPRDLDELVERYGDYTTWPGSTIACSAPKDGPRRLRADEEQGIYIAETIVDGAVRETEVVFENLRTDGQLDFVAYTAAGKLTDRSTFATPSSDVTSAAPYTCMSCHLDVDAGAFIRLFPTGTGAGCK
jgi:hypothetical protein